MGWLYLLAEVYKSTVQNGIINAPLQSIVSEPPCGATVMANVS